MNSLTENYFHEIIWLPIGIAKPSKTRRTQQVSVYAHKISFIGYINYMPIRLIGPPLDNFTFPNFRDYSTIYQELLHEVYVEVIFI